MPGPRRTHRSDATQDAIIKALQGIGATVQKLSGVGGGVPDLLVGFRGLNLLIEVKGGTPGYGLRDSQGKWIESWLGQVAVAYSSEMAIQQVLAAAWKAGVLA